ncbi:MAG: copper resistance protein CopC, partial [Chloroflexota bacterium]|nr:copper resistance protein CopC [Chloroflexota bacterium]
MPQVRVKSLVAWLVLALLAGAGALAAFPQTALAHATLGSTDPPANEIVASSPGRVELRFTEPVEETYTTVILVDQLGQEVGGTSFQIESTDATLVRLTIPDDLARGTYSVVWRTLSAADGHRFSGYFAFTIGSTADVRTVIPPTFDADAGAPDWLNYGSRWLVFLALSALAGLWFAWLAFVRPALAPVWQAAPGIVPRIRIYAFLAGALYLAANALALLVQVWGQTEGDAIGSVIDTLTDTRWGNRWILRMLIGSLLTIALMVAPWWWPRRRRSMTAVILLLSAILPLPHALVSHSSAAQIGRTEAIMADYYHLIAMVAWFGGLLLILAVMRAGSDLLPGGRWAYLVRLMPRFSVVALVCWAALGLSGFYAGYLHVGAWSGLTDTEYGRSLLYKLFAVVI